MSIKISGYTFQGPYSYVNTLENKSGVYAIICVKSDDEWTLLDVGEAAKVKERVETHDRKKCWEEKCKYTIKYAVHYTPGSQQTGRMEIEQAIRKAKYVPCGEK